MMPGLPTYTRKLLAHRSCSFGSFVASLGSCMGYSRGDVRDFVDRLVGLDGYGQILGIFFYVDFFCCLRIWSDANLLVYRSRQLL
ncbi:hypothetical protein EON63_19430 [archaeon]|nr:MAG: hypothetical protein EON63_19430 [archaeon]